MQPGGQPQTDARESRITDLKLAAGLYAHTPLFAWAWDEVFTLRAQQLNEQREQGRAG